ncbi:L,D-transpeptidase family protein [Marichromatium bheemlicum]|uniref:L,D-transpeptidase family protein n=1 Tax=Marichromatium bheemlicum TaxID=365339 RepID=UPI001FE60315|nr:L,D-transpeptidase family protein [Marichromatium bheemlicum]
MTKPRFRHAHRALSAALLGALTLAATVKAPAETYRLEHPGDSVIGFPFYFATRADDTLLDVARQNNQGFEDMRSANPEVDMWVPGAGTEVMVPTFYVLPDAPRQGIVINRPEKRLYFYPPNDPEEVRSYAISVGREGMDTPLGSFTIIEKKRDPSWTPGPSVRAAHAAYGDILPAVVPPGPDNPLGQFAMRLSDPEYLIHGTSKPWGLGMEVSAGCIRLYPEGIEELFSLTELRTQVTIVDQPYKLGWRGDDLYLEVHIDREEKRQAARAVIPATLVETEGVKIDWHEVQRAIDENTGVPLVVGHRVRSDHEPYLPMIF